MPKMHKNATCFFSIEGRSEKLHLCHPGSNDCEGYSHLRGHKIVAASAMCSRKAPKVEAAYSHEVIQELN